MRTFTLCFPISGGRSGEVELEWSRHKALKGYLKEPPLSEYHLMGVRKRCVILDQQRNRLRLSYVPRPGDRIVLVKQSH